MIEFLSFPHYFFFGINTMKIILKIILLSCLNLAFTSTCYSMQTLFYVLHSNTPETQPMLRTALKRLESHHNNIDALITQAYQIDADGTVSGYTNKEILDFANQ